MAIGVSVLVTEIVSEVDLVRLRVPVGDTVTVGDIVRVKGNVVAIGVSVLVKDTVNEVDLVIVGDIDFVNGHVVAIGVNVLVTEIVNEVDPDRVIPVEEMVGVGDGTGERDTVKDLVRLLV